MSNPNNPKKAKVKFEFTTKIGKIKSIDEIDPTSRGKVFYDDQFKMPVAGDITFVNMENVEGVDYPSGVEIKPAIIEREITIGDMQKSEQLENLFCGFCKSLIKTDSNSKLNTYFKKDPQAAKIKQGFKMNIINEPENGDDSPIASSIASSRRKRIEGDYICENCILKKQLVPCFHCGHLQEDDLIEGFCLNCIQSAPTKQIKPYTLRVESRFSELISKSHSKFSSELAMETYKDYDPQSFSLNAGGVFKNLFGIELEYETKAYYGLTILKVHKLLGELAASKDGLRAEIKKDATLKNGFEIVSAPADKKSHRHIWELLFKLIENDSNIVCTPYFFDPAKMERGTGCGCHIHVSKDSLMYHNDYEINGRVLPAGHGLALVKMTTFIHSPQNKVFIETIAGRPSGMHFDFLKPKGIQFNKEGKIIKKDGLGARNCLTMESGAGHRTALNFNTSTHQTIEFRFFNATKSYETLLIYLDFVDGLCSFCRASNASLSEMRNWHNFYEFILKNRYDYQLLAKYFSKNLEFLKLLEKNPKEEVEKKIEIDISNKTKNNSFTMNKEDEWEIPKNYRSFSRKEIW